MSTTHQQQTRDRDRSRQRSADRYAETSHTQFETPTTAAGTKRLFSNRQSRLSYNSEDHGENDDRQSEDTGASYSDKRQRSSDWPLSNPSPLRDRHASRDNSPPSPHRPNQRKRPSKFQEGSMNDRVSQKPPITYLNTDEFLDARYQGERVANGRKTRPRTFTHHPNSSLSGETDVSRHSSIFRFGKSIAASFNPSNWKIWSKNQPEPEDDGEAARQRILMERQEKAEKIYKELKQSGHFRDAQVPYQSRGRFGDNTPLAKHDSGVVMGDGGPDSRLSVESVTSREDKRRGVVFLEAPQLLSTQASASPASNTGSGNRSSTSSPTKQPFHFKKPSLSNIKKAFKDESLGDVTCNGEHQARRVPSRKDLQKQQKLVKRVSDLEGKLEAARRQLNEALATPVPTQMPPRVGRPRFVPGAMPTLPSERLLSGYMESKDELCYDEADGEIGKAVSFDVARNDPSDADATNGEDSSKMNPVSSAQSSAWADKPLPSIGVSHHDQAVQSIEMGDDEANLREVVTTSSERSTDSNAFHLGDYKQQYGMEEEEEEEEAVGGKGLDSDQESTPKFVESQNKKRKNRLEIEAFDGGNRKPILEASSEFSSSDKKTTLRKKAAISTSRKLQKTIPSQPPPPKYPPPPPPTTVETSTAHLLPEPTSRLERPTKALKTSPNADSSSTSPNRDSPQRRNTLKSKRAPSATSSSSNRRDKTTIPQKQPQLRQSVSPPPSSSFAGLQYSKPSNVSGSGSHMSLHSNTKGEGVPASLTSETIPPMPKLPRAVRLPTGEVVNVNPPPVSDPAAGHSSTFGGSSGSRGSKLVKSRREGKAIAVGQSGVGDLLKGKPGDENESTGDNSEANHPSRTEIPKSQSKASFEWPEDVF